MTDKKQDWWNWNEKYIIEMQENGKKLENYFFLREKKKIYKHLSNLHKFSIQQKN